MKLDHHTIGTNHRQKDLVRIYYPSWNQHMMQLLSYQILGLNFKKDSEGSYSVSSHFQSFIVAQIVPFTLLRSCTTTESQGTGKLEHNKTFEGTFLLSGSFKFCEFYKVIHRVKSVVVCPKSPSTGRYILKWIQNMSHVYSKYDSIIPKENY